MLEILDKITAGKATMEDLDKLEELCEHLKENSLCALGQTAPNPSTIQLSSSMTINPPEPIMEPMAIKLS